MSRRLTRSSMTDVVSFISYLRILPAALLLAGCATRPPRLVPVGEFALPQDTPEGLSGIAWLGDGNYALAEDSGGRIHRAHIDLDAATGAITNCVFTDKRTIPGLVDAEGIAYDTQSGRLYVSDESGPKILEIVNDTVSPPIRIPEFLSHTRPYKSQ